MIGWDSVLGSRGSYFDALIDPCTARKAHIPALLEVMGIIKNLIFMGFCIEGARRVGLLYKMRKADIEG